MSIQTIAAAKQALREGDLRRAESAISQSGVSDLEALTLRSEILFLAGHSAKAAALSAELLPKLSETDELRAQALFVAGACAWELGDQRKGVGQLEKAEAYAKNSANWSLVSRIRLQILERSSDSS